MLISNLQLTLNYSFYYPLTNTIAFPFGLENLNMQSLLVVSSYDLLVDISEGFGIWIALLVLMNSSLTLTSFTQQVNEPIIMGWKNNSSIIWKNNSPTSLSYNIFLRFL